MATPATKDDIDRLQGNLDRLQGNLDRAAGEMKQDLDRAAGEMKELMDRKIDRVIDLMQLYMERLDTRFENQATRMDRQAALIQTGSRWTGRMNEWPERIDTALGIKDRQIADLAERIRKLEDRNLQ